MSPDFVILVRLMEQDCTPNGWPAIEMRKLTAAADELVALRARVAELEQRNRADEYLVLAIREMQGDVDDSLLIERLFEIQGFLRHGKA